MKKEFSYGDDLRVSFESAEISEWMVNGYN